MLSHEHVSFSMLVDLSDDVLPLGGGVQGSKVAGGLSCLVEVKQEMLKLMTTVWMKMTPLL